MTDLVPTPTAPPDVEQVRRGPALRISRWWVAVAATVLVVVGAVGVIAAAGNAATASATAAYVPADVVAYVEIRLDFPGDQRDQASRLLQHFPGLLDSAILDDKVGMALDRALGTATDGRYHYTSDIAPWVTGQAAVAVCAAESAAGSPFRPAILVGVKDEAAAAAQLDRFRADAVAAGARAETTAVNGTTAWTISGPWLDANFEMDLGAGIDAPASVSYALTSDMLVITEDAAEIGQYLSAKAAEVPSLAGSQAYRDAFARAPDGRVGGVYVDGTALARLLKTELPAAAFDALPIDVDPFSKFPASIAGWLRLEGDRVIADSRASGLAEAPTVAVRESKLSGMVPADALVYAETRDAGKTIAAALTELMSMPGVEEQLSDLTQVESLLGSDLAHFFDWVGDLGIAVLPGAGEIPRIGILAEAIDPTVAGSRVGLLRTLLAFGGQNAGVTVTDTRHGDVTITVVDLSGVIPDAPTDEPLALAWALDGDRFILGLGVDTVAALLDARGGTTLATDGRFRDLLSAAGGPATAGFAYVNVAGVRPLIESMAVTPLERKRYETDVRPYLGPVDRLLVASGRDGDSVTGRVVITVAASPQP